MANVGSNGSRPLRWAERKRIEFMQERLKLKGFFTRDEIMEAFGIGPTQVKRDLSTYEKLGMKPAFIRERGGVCVNPRKRVSAQ